MVILVGCPSVLDIPSEEPSDTGNNAASTPIFSLTPSDSFTSAQTLEIDSPTEGTTARYEFATTDTNGDSDIDLDDVSDPTSASTPYIAPISILPNVGDVYCIKGHSSPSRRYLCKLARCVCLLQATASCRNADLQHCTFQQPHLSADA